MNNKLHNTAAQAMKAAEGKKIDAKNSLALFVGLYEAGWYSKQELSSSVEKGVNAYLNAMNERAGAQLKLLGYI